MKLRAHIILCEGLAGRERRYVRESNTERLIIVFSRTVDEAVAEARTLANEGAELIELSGSPGAELAALVRAEIGSRCAVGYVTFGIGSLDGERRDLPVRGLRRWLRTLVLRGYPNALLKRTLRRARPTPVDQLSPRLREDIGMPPDPR